MLKKNVYPAGRTANDAIIWMDAPDGQTINLKTFYTLHLTSLLLNGQMNTISQAVSLMGWPSLLPLP